MSNPTDARLEAAPVPRRVTPSSSVMRGTGEDGHTVTGGPERRGTGPLVITVIGVPVGQGNIRYSKIGRGYHANGKELKPWRTNIRQAALTQLNRHEWMGWDGLDPKYCAVCRVLEAEHAIYPQGPVTLTATLVVPKPKSAPKRRRTWPVTRFSSDWDHLGRAISDALTGVMWRDDSQIVDGRVRKLYPDDPDAPLAESGAVIAVQEIRS